MIKVFFWKFKFGFKCRTTLCTTTRLALLNA